MTQILLSFTTTEAAPSAEEVERELGLPAGAIDRRFGVVEVDEIAHEYTVLVNRAMIARLRPSDRLTVSGEFSNPPISGF
jgi:hypothetical protein